MKKNVIFSIVAVAAAITVEAGWWPWSDDSSDKKEQPRLSELMEPASMLIDEAADLASDGKPKEAIDKYREALKKLDQIEAENPDRAKKPEFATLRNKRAYVSAAIDSMLLAQIKGNAKAVAVSDTTELEKKLAAEKASNRGRDSAEKMKLGNPNKSSRKDQFMRALKRGEFEAAEDIVKSMFEARPKSPAAFALKAMLEVKRGRPEIAEKTLDECIMANRENYFAYYNMARLKLKKGDKEAAKRYYESGRSAGGPEDKKLEEKLK